MALLTTERLFWYCGAHTAEPSRFRRFLIIKICCSLRHVVNSLLPKPVSTRGAGGAAGCFIARNAAFSSCRVLCNVGDACPSRQTIKPVALSLCSDFLEATVDCNDGATAYTKTVAMSAVRPPLPPTPRRHSTAIVGFALPVLAQVRSILYILLWAEIERDPSRWIRNHTKKHLALPEKSERKQVA